MILNRLSLGKSVACAPMTRRVGSDTSRPCLQAYTMQQDETLTFGPFELRRRRRELLADGKPVELGSRAFDILLALIDAGGSVVAKSELMDLVWPGTAVEENNLSVQIHTLRRALGEDRRMIVTVAGRGYRFAGALRAGSSVPRLSIVVLPFTSWGDDREQQHVADGITEDLTTDLSRLADMTVISRKHHGLWDLS